MEIRSFKKENMFSVWDDYLLGKTVMTADTLSMLYERLESIDNEQLETTVVYNPDDPSHPFLDARGVTWQFAYVIEPATDDTNNSAIKNAYRQGHVIVRRYSNHGGWEGVISTSYFDLPGYEYRVASHIPSRVTNKVLALWLVEGNGLLLDVRLDRVYTSYTFPAEDIDCEVLEGYKVMPKGGTHWLEPTTEVCKLKGDTN